ncbi:MAG: LytTR family DNA-binding domain-containing protein [Clostridia bacterium]
MNIAIVDDSTNDRKSILNFFQQYVQEYSRYIRLFVYENGEKFLSTADLSDIDVLFLDIYMEKLTGIDVAHKVRDKNCTFPIVFITSSNDYAVKSYEVRAFDYIVKPITYDKIVTAMDLLQKESAISSRIITVKEGREMRKVALSDILYVDYDNHYIQIHTKNSIISTYIKFLDFEQMLKPFSNFITCYRCLIVNMDFIEKIEENFFLLNNGEYIPINRNNSKEIKKIYTNYIFGKLEDATND